MRVLYVLVKVDDEQVSEPKRESVIIKDVYFDGGILARGSLAAMVAACRLLNDECVNA